MKSIIVVVVLSLLASFSVGAGTFIETFDDGDLEGWQELNVHDVVPASWEIIDGELQGINPEAAGFLITGDETWQDYSIEVDVKPLEKRGPGFIGIAARVKGTWAVWCEITDLLLHDPESKVACSSRDLHKNTGQLLYLGPHPFLRLNKWSTLKLSVNGDRFIFSINGKKIVESGKEFILIHDGREFRLKTWDLSRHPTDAGGAGFGLAYYTARFDNVTITGDSIPNRGGLSVKPTGKLATTWGSLRRF